MIIISLLHETLDHLVGIAGVFLEACNKDTVFIVFSDFKTANWTIINRNQQILDFLIIDLHHAELDLVLLFLVLFVRADLFEDFLTDDGYYSPVCPESDH